MNFKKICASLSAFAVSISLLTSIPSVEIKAYNNAEKELNNSTLVEQTYVSDEIIQFGGYPKLNNTPTGELKRYNTTAAAAALQNILENAANTLNEDTISVRSLSLTKEDISVAFNNTNNENPQFFYLGNSLTYYMASDSTINYVKLNYKYSVSQIPAMRRSFENAVQKIINCLNPSWSNLQKSLFIHDYLVTNARYDTSYTRYDAYSLLVDKTAVCQGYALAYSYLMEKIGIPDKVVTSKSINHAWNMSKINSSWYFIDATWDDPTPDKQGYVSHQNFLRSESGFRNTGHTGYDWVTSYASVRGICTDITYDSYYWQSIYTPILTPNNSTTPATPKVKATPGNGKVTLAWSPISGATSYRVYSYANGKYTAIANTSSTSYTKTGLKNGTKYTFLVLASNGKTWSKYTAANNVSAIPAVLPPSTPVVKAASGNGSVKLTWSHVSGAINYRIFSYFNGKYTIIGNTTSNSFTKLGLKNGTKYTFLVLAYNGSSWSKYTTANNVSATPSLPVPITPVVRATSGNGRVTLSWNHTNGAASYRIYSYYNGKYTVIGNTASNTFTKTGLKNGTKYTFLVLAYNGAAWSKYTTANHVSAIPAVPPPATPVVKATAGNGNVTLTWAHISGAKSYRIYQYYNGKYTIVGNTASNTFTKTGLKNGSKYTFLVLAYNGSLWSKYSTANHVSSIPSIKVPATPAVKATAGIGKATLSWNHVSGATTYRIYRYVNGKYVIVGNTSANTFTQNGLTSKNSYTYLVLAYNGSSWSRYSSANHVTVKVL